MMVEFCFENQGVIRFQSLQLYQTNLALQPSLLSSRSCYIAQMIYMDCLQYFEGCLTDVQHNLSLGSSVGVVKNRTLE